MSAGPNSSRQPDGMTSALIARADILGRIRAFFSARDVFEVQTPVLGRYTVTDPDVAGIEVPGYGYLQTSPEYFMKRLLVAGMPDCYQLGPAFRADETGKLHNSEFTLLEWYRLDFDHEDLMGEVAALIDLVLGPGEFQRVTYAELVGDIDLPRDELDLIFAQACEEITGRSFVVDYPADQAALARMNTHDATTAARFELLIDGVEIANGYWELTDAAEHRTRFAEDLRIRQQRVLPTPEVDRVFLEALETGLPPCAGVALGVDRLIMLALHQTSIDQVLAFRF